MKVVEITGLPKAGKTSLVNRLAVQLRAQGLKVKKIIDVSGKSPVDPNNIWLNQTWIAHRLLDKILDKNNEKFDVILVHRGMAERIATVNTYFKFKLITSKQAKLMSEYFSLFLSLEDLVIYLDITPRISLLRNHGRKGKMINNKFLTIMRKYYLKYVPKFVDKYFKIDADQELPAVVAEVKDLILALVKKK